VIFEVPNISKGNTFDGNLISKVTTFGTKLERLVNKSLSLAF